MLRWLAISLLLHFAVVGAFFLKARFFEEPPVEAPLVVELDPSTDVNPPTLASQAEPSSSEKTNSKRGGGGAGTASRLSLNDLGVGWVGAGERRLVPSETLNAANAGEFDRGGKDGVLGKLRHDHIYRTLYEQLNAALIYPADLGDQGIDGNVKARIVLSSDGHFLREKSHVTATSKYLKVFVYRLLKKVFPPGTAGGAGKEVILQCDFEFHLRSDEDLQAMPQATQRQALGNQFYFARNYKRNGQWNMGPISGYYFIPSFNVDPEAVVAEIKRLGKVEKDPLEDYQNDPEFGTD